MLMLISMWLPGMRWELLTSEAVEVIGHLDGNVESLLLDLGETI
jgi:hypothetical protein